MNVDLKLWLLVAFAVATGALGALLLRAPEAHAQDPRRFRECVAMWTSNHFSHAGNRDHLRSPEGRFPIPHGWTPIGGGGPTNSATVILCR